MTRRSPRERAKKAARVYIRDMAARSRIPGHSTKASAQSRLHDAHKKLSTPAQLDREIAEALSRKRGSAGGTVSHARLKARAPRVTAYRIHLTPDELRAVEFARGRYAWPDMLSAHAADNGAVAFTESEMWQWADDVDSDATGGGSPFPLTSRALADKLQRFYDSRI